MTKTTLILAAALAALTAAPRLARAADDGQLWEVKTKMDMPDMPQSKKHRELPPEVAARMGASGMMGGERVTQVCRGEDPREEVTKNKNMEDCKVEDFKDSGNKVTMTAVCKKGRSAKMEIVFNKGRTAYTGSMHMTDEKGRAMEMTMSGRKLGPCDAKKAHDERAATAAKYKAQADASQAQYKEMTKQATDKQIADCNKAVEKMDPEGLGMYGSCRGRDDGSCKQIVEMTAKQQPEVAKACDAKADELCKRYQTTDGFMKASRDSSRLEHVAAMCRVPAEKVRAKLCPGAEKIGAYEFIGTSCPEEAKPLAKAHCAGKSYTVKEGDPRRVEKKWFAFCKSVAGAYASGSDDAEQQAEERPSKRRKAAEDPKEAVKEALTPDKAVDAGINKLKGLFGH